MPKPDVVPVMTHTFLFAGIFTADDGCGANALAKSKFHALRAGAAGVQDDDDDDDDDVTCSDRIGANASALDAAKASRIMRDCAISVNGSRARTVKGVEVWSRIQVRLSRNALSGMV